MRSRRASSRQRAAAALLPLLLLGGACGAMRSGSAGAGSGSASAGSGSASAGSGSAGSGAGSAGEGMAARAALVGEIEAMLAPVEAARRAELRALASELAADWAREAGHDPDADPIVDVLRRELAAKLTAVRGSATDAGLEVVRAEVYDRRARALSRRSFELGKAVIDGAITDSAARDAGEQILHEVAALVPQVRALRDPERVRVLSGDLQEVSLEATFALERGATSRRLSDYRSSRSGAPEVR